MWITRECFEDLKLVFVDWLSGTNLANLGKLENRGKFCPTFHKNNHDRLARGLLPLSIDHDFRVDHDKGGIRARFSCGWWSNCPLVGSQLCKWKPAHLHKTWHYQRLVGMLFLFFVPWLSLIFFNVASTLFLFPGNLVSFEPDQYQWMLVFHGIWRITKPLVSLECLCAYASFELLYVF